MERERQRHKGPRQRQAKREWHLSCDGEAWDDSSSWTLFQGLPVSRPAGCQTPAMLWLHGKPSLDQQWSGQYRTLAPRVSTTHPGCYKKRLIEHKQHILDGREPFFLQASRCHHSSTAYKVRGANWCRLHLRFVSHRIEFFLNPCFVPGHSFQRRHSTLACLDYVPLRMFEAGPTVTGLVATSICRRVRCC